MAVPSSPASDIALAILAIFLPALAVFFKKGLKADFWINVLLWILGWFPAILHAWWIIYKSKQIIGTTGTGNRVIGTTGTAGTTTGGMRGPKSGMGQTTGAAAPAYGATGTTGPTTV